MSDIREFKTESKQLLDLMINSIYTHREIFLRELISNASDAIDKYNYLALSDERIKTKVENKIEIILNKDDRTITIKDNGIGMTKDELIDNLGTIAKSGTKAFLEKIKESKENDQLDVIGQFGVGFYSAYLVASKVLVKTKSVFAENSFMWESSGESTYSIDLCEKLDQGTEVILYLREDDEEENYSDYLEEWKVKDLVKKYSDYVRYPIMMDVTTYEEENEVIEKTTLNSMKPIWKKNKNEVTDEELNNFYKYQFHEYEEPLKVINMNVEGLINYQALIFIPKKAPYDLYSEKFEKGLQLYCKGVFIMDKCKELVPDYFRFIKGLVESPDLPLNISREILQHNKQLVKIASNLEKKIKNELEKMLANERELYTEFYKNYGVNLKYGIYDQFGAKKDLLKDLVMFISSKTGEYSTFKEYVARMNEGQEFIYYASGNNKEQIERLPQMEQLKAKDLEVLYFTDDIDEFAINILSEYEGKKFKSISQGDLKLETEEEKEQLETKAKEYQDLITFLKDSLNDKVGDVKLSSRLKESAVCLVSKEGLSLEMEKILASMPGGNNMMKAEKVLEINPNHQLFKALESLYKSNKALVKDYANLLYSQALLIEGFSIENPIEFANKMCELMIHSANVQAN